MIPFQIQHTPKGYPPPLKNDFYIDVVPTQRRGKIEFKSSLKTLLN